MSPHYLENAKLLHVIEGNVAASDPQHCWRRVCLPAMLASTAHRARDTIRLLRRETSQFISPDMWPANSPGINPVDYSVWGMLQQRLYRVPIRDTDELRKRLVATWAEFQQSVVNDAADQWRKRLEACIRAEGGHFEHLF